MTISFLSRPALVFRRLMPACVLLALVLAGCTGQSSLPALHPTNDIAGWNNDFTGFGSPR